MRSLLFLIVGVIGLAAVMGTALWLSRQTEVSPDVNSSTDAERAEDGPTDAVSADEGSEVDGRAGSRDALRSVPDEHSGAGDTEHDPIAEMHTDVVKIWETWPRPELALLITGEQHGFFEPCGCTANQLGGLSRRADLAKKLQEAGWTVRGIDLGSLVRRSTRQAQIKFETTLQALRDLKYVAMGIGPEELRLRPDFLLSQHISDADAPLSFLSANLVFYETPELGTPLPTAIVQEAGMKLGITSVISETQKKSVIPEGAESGMTWSEAIPALEKALAKFETESVDFRILLSQGTVDESKALAERFPGFDVVVTAEGVSDPDPHAAPEKVGDTPVLQVGRKGKYTGVLGIYPSDRDNPLRFQIIPLERRDFDDSEIMIQHMRTYQERLKDEQIVLNDGEAAHPSGATFVGSDACGDCHTTAYEIWKESGHAQALESLDPSNKRHGYERLNGVPRMFDPECLSCHVTGWHPQKYLRYESGFLNKEFARNAQENHLHELLAGSGCENCHGPGSRHLELVNDDKLDLARQEMRVTLEQAKDSLCYTCHDVDNSPDFEFDEYWEHVKHYGLD